MAVSLAVLALAVTLLACGESDDAATTTSTASSSAGVTTTVAGIEITSDPSLTAMLPSGIRDAGEIRVATNMPYPPWEMYVEEGSEQATGLDYDLSQALAAKLGVEATFEQTAFDGLIPAILAGKRDVIMAAMFDTVERQKELDFVDYAWEGTTILVEKGNPEGIYSLDDLSGKTVAIQSGAYSLALLEEKQAEFEADGKPSIKIIKLPQQSDALLAIQAGKAVASTFDLSGQAYTAKTSDDGNAFEVVIDPLFPQGYNPGLVGIGVPKTNTQLRDAMQAALQALIDEGVYLQILEKYALGAAAVESAEVNQAKM